jgi:hypothetical protein
MYRPVNKVKANDTANSRYQGGKPDFELDSKFDFLYSEFFKQSGLSVQFNANPVITGNTFI